MDGAKNMSSTLCATDRYTVRTRSFPTESPEWPLVACSGTTKGEWRERKPRSSSLSQTIEMDTKFCRYYISLTNQLNLRRIIVPEYTSREPLSAYPRNSPKVRSSTAFLETRGSSLAHTFPLIDCACSGIRCIVWQQPTQMQSCHRVPVAEPQQDIERPTCPLPPQSSS